MNTQAAAAKFLESPLLSDGTRRAYRFDVEEFVRWLGDRKLESVDVRVLAEYVGYLGSARNGRGRLAPATITRKLAAVRGFMRHALGPAYVADARLAPARRGDAPARRRRRSAREPGPARPLGALDGAAVCARGGEAAPQSLPLRPPPLLAMDPAVESCLGLSAARLAPRTVEAYRRDLRD